MFVLLMLMLGRKEFRWCIGRVVWLMLLWMVSVLCVVGWKSLWC